MSKAKKTALTSFFVLLVTGLVVAGALAIKPEATSTTPTPTSAVSTQPTATTNTMQPSDSNSMMSSMHFKDGTYTTTEGYDTPEGTESIGISITLANDVITNTSATKMSKSRESRAYQEDFIASYASFVVGKKITDLKLGIVAGASLTTIGFNQALDTIRTQAQS